MMQTVSKFITFAVLAGIFAFSAKGLFDNQAPTPTIDKSMEIARSDARALEFSVAEKKSAKSLQQKYIQLAANNAVERKVNMTHTGNATGYTDSSDHNWEKAKNASKETWEDTKESSKEAMEKTKDASDDAWEATKEKTDDAVEATKDGSQSAWEKTKEVSADAWDKTKEVSSDVWEKTKEVSKDAWEGTKDVFTPDHTPDNH